MARRGRSRAQVAVAHSILVSAYYMLSRDEPYRDLGPDWLRRRDDEAHARRLVTQLPRGTNQSSGHDRRTRMDRSLRFGTLPLYRMSRNGKQALQLHLG
jgi:hypothetical protein